MPCSAPIFFHGNPLLGHAVATAPNLLAEFSAAYPSVLEDHAADDARSRSEMATVADPRLADDLAPLLHQAAGTDVNRHEKGTLPFILTRLAEGDGPQSLQILRRSVNRGLPCGAEKCIQRLEKMTG